LKAVQFCSAGCAGAECLEEIAKEIPVFVIRLIGARLFFSLSHRQAGGVNVGGGCIYWAQWLDSWGGEHRAAFNVNAISSWWRFALAINVLGSYINFAP